MPDQTAAQILTDAITEGTELHTNGVPETYGAAMAVWLRLNGAVVLELPLADEHGNFLPNAGRTEVWVEHRPDGVMVNQGRRHRHSYSTPADARRLGTALIAAADAAEANR